MQFSVQFSIFDGTCLITLISHKIGKNSDFGTLLAISSYLVLANVHKRQHFIKNMIALPTGSGKCLHYLCQEEVL